MNCDESLDHGFTPNLIFMDIKNNKTVNTLFNFFYYKKLRSIHSANRKRFSITWLGTLESSEIDFRE